MKNVNKNIVNIEKYITKSALSLFSSVNSALYVLF